MAKKAKKKVTVMSAALQAAQAARKRESARREKLSDEVRFGEDATRITSVVIRHLRKLGRLATREGFAYTKEQREKMYQAIRREVDQSESRYIVKTEGIKKGAAEFQF